MGRTISFSYIVLAEARYQRSGRDAIGRHNASSIHSVYRTALLGDGSPDPITIASAMELGCSLLLPETPAF